VVLSGLIGLAVVVAVCGVIIVLFADPTLLFCAAVAGTLLSGNADHVQLPFSPDRLFFAAALLSMVIGFGGDRQPSKQRLRGVDVIILLAAAYAVASAFAAGTLLEHDGFFGLLDRLGLVPFAAFVVAPRLFRTPRQRRALLITFVAIGFYLGLTALFETVSLDPLVFPSYIKDPSVGIHFGRARGPFIEAAANGLALFECGVAAAVATRVFSSRASRRFAMLVVMLCAAGVLFSLTRAAWFGAIAGAMAGIIFCPPGRRRLVGWAALSVVAVGALLLLLPGLGGRAGTRAEDQRPIWDRFNTNAASIRVIEDHPLLGVGWNRFQAVNADYERQADGYPLTGSDLVVHNVVLSHLAELGVVGGGLWLVALGAAVVAAWRGSSRLGALWRAGMVAVVVDFAVVANLGPLGYAFPNLALWLWLGVCAAQTPFPSTKTAAAEYPASWQLEQVAQPGLP
jgi:O-antigen ligase